MEIVCFDMEGTLTPEIWEQIALNTGVEEFNKTTRDIPDYSDLMDFRLEVIEDFLNSIRSNFQVVILSDTFHEIAKPLMEKMGHPLLLCHNLEVENDEVISYKLRHKQAKKQAIMAFQSIGYRCIAAGDSYNDIQMFEVAEKGFFMNAPEKIAASHPDIPSFHNYDDLEDAILKSSIFVK
ncbi:MAG: bifunctional phosphoserine phosphatase/homoserine phosphotransferase ThrH [Proteobacteria bacterium]|nr:bifunctional phosphoserine phosphatase/homoserine phosphotransferase ThrH [Pseudomonadota bacterium]